VTWTALLDACVLFPTSTRDLLLRGAERYLYQIRWSGEILAELRRALQETAGVPADGAGRLVEIMETAFPEAAVEGYAGLVSQMTNHPGDRHVLAAAVVGQTDVIVTDNIRHFPEDACEPYGIEVQTPDEFLSYSFDLAPQVVADIYLQQVDEFHRPTFTLDEALSTLARRLPDLSARLRVRPEVNEALRRRG
jgi:hypothetical protein